MLKFITNLINMFKKQENTPLAEYDYANDYVSPANFILHKKTSDVIVPDINIRNNVGKDVPTILIMEDYPGMVDLLYTEVIRIQCCHVPEKFNIITATEEYAAFTVKEYLDNGGKIDIAFLDITLGGIKDGVELDGIDIAIMIKKSNPDCEIRFITGHTLNKRNPEIFEFMQKFYNETGLQIDEEETILEIKTQEPITIRKHLIGKNGNRVLLMAIAFEQWLLKHGKIDIKTGKCLL